ncbi:MAG: monovalent cation/H+ antiporter subunit D family protein [Brevibacterium sp.]|nr:monovalent cation/H+ antiporter subunit D family protein [Brevibacterium sp.]MDN5833576.1 monovalent cation/H+ antiporter subunit D family protein [Brevibacterium sp.]MDN5876862.1 monovalent cation/H+ antiporter subunit D family protein [Brevibacterium sp.]MDN5909033.1 monovalent cation/H+ antiporter subunit D family protein [Brevibacterium sp.]MDN6134146.1 monovalent cation/H+ antiporter subunit D family protein [Brevibacterium sp.]
MNSAFLLLLIGVPLLSSALSVLITSRAVDRFLLLAAPIFVGVSGVLLLLVHERHPVIAHSVGGYVPGLAIPFVSDTFTALMLVLTSMIAVVSCIFLITTGEDQYRFVPALILMMLTGVYGALLTGDLFNFFVFVEVMVLPGYALIAVTGTWRRLGVGRMYVMVNLLTSTILLIGVGFVYGSLGSVNIAIISRMGTPTGQGALAIGVVLLALIIKAGGAPFHGWLVRSYPNTSAGMMALFSGLHSKVAVYAIYRIYTSVYGDPAPWVNVIVVISIASILIGSLSGFGQNRVRNVLAFQMTAGIGHILLGVVLLTSAALGAGAFYMVHHMITMSGLLLIMGAVEQTYGTGSFKKLSGLASRERWATTLMVLGLFSLIGLPPTSGLWGKVGLITAATGSRSTIGWWLVGAIVIGAVISLLALQRTWRNTFWGQPMQSYHPDSADTGRAPAEPITRSVRIPARLLVPGTFMIALSVAIFVYPEPLLEIVDRAAVGLLDHSEYIGAVIGS